MFLPLKFDTNTLKITILSRINTKDIIFFLKSKVI